MSLGPQPVLIGKDVQINCTVMQVPVKPRIAVNDKEESIQTLAENSDKYTLIDSTITNGVVYVLTLHNVSVSDNRTRFECYVRQHERRITSGARVLRVAQERITVNKGIGCGEGCACVCCSSGTRVLRVGYKGENVYNICITCNLVHT